MIIVRTYTFTSPAFEGELIFGYNQHGVMVMYQVEAELKPEQLSHLVNNLPVYEEKLQEMVNASKKGAEARLVEVDLSFDRFWNDYNHKVGNKGRAERLWSALSKHTKLRVLEHIPRYDRQLAVSKIAKCYPETYLNQERWELG